MADFLSWSQRYYLFVNTKPSLPIQTQIQNHGSKSYQIYRFLKGCLWVGEIDEWVKCLTLKNKYLSLSPETPHKNVGMGSSVIICAPGRLTE